jgi:hypothetical protein
VGSLSPTREECGRAFTQRASKGDFQVSKGGNLLCEQEEKGCKKGMRGFAMDISMGCDVHVSLLVCIYVNKVVFRL